MKLDDCKIYLFMDKNYKPTDSKKNLLQFKKFISKEQGYIIVTIQSQQKTYELVMGEHLFPDKLLIRNLYMNRNKKQNYSDDILKQFVYNFSSKIDKKNVNQQIKSNIETIYQNWGQSTQEFQTHINTWYKSSFIQNKMKHENYKLLLSHVYIDGKEFDNYFYLKQVKTTFKDMKQHISQNLINTAQKCLQQELKNNTIHISELLRLLSLHTNNDQQYETLLYHILYDLKNKKSIDDIRKMILNKQILWHRECFKDIQDDLQTGYEIIMNPFEIVEGITECGKCGSTKVFMFQKQTRSCDETMTTFCHCVNRNCGNSWTYSG